MLIGVIADDFTGASDIGSVIAGGIDGKGGLRTVQYLGVPQQRADDDVDAGVVALKSRSIPVSDAVRQSLQALEWLRVQGCRQILFKYCSTFDSTPRGNIGPVAEALAEALQTKGVVVCPASPILGRTVYRGHLFVGDRLLSESGMESHPVTPMTDPDIRRWLTRQCTYPVGCVAWPIVSEGPEAVCAALDENAHLGNVLVVVDALTELDLATIGKAVRDAPLVTGGSGIAASLSATFLAGEPGRRIISTCPRQNGAAVILAGSCSAATRAQIAVHQCQHRALEIDVADLLDGRIGPHDVLEFLWEARDPMPLVYSSASPAAVLEIQEQYGVDAVSTAVEHLFGVVAVELRKSGWRRLVVAGGETSGAVVTALNIDRFEIGPEIAPGVPVLVERSGDPMLLALKSGNFGAPDFFETAIARMGGGQ